MSDYRRMLEDGYVGVLGFDDAEMSRLEYLGEYIFNFTTYDSDMSELFASKALEVCAAISSRTTFDYIKDPEQYRWFLIMCNMPFFADRLEWGTSIRGAWWCQPYNGLIEFDGNGLVEGDEQVGQMHFNAEQWVEFIAAILLFAADNAKARP